ncbi:hemin uptake protein HemP [Arvimicrobium flavum]|uniref:hemin uptake protein HemP n=1 Tax=Arvimicrobium flavum TaxID=3393320 RepID=UPI00237AB21E|nr:hemin uptake protein HemP [Mesorhizobium shangrilense]
MNTHNPKSFQFRYHRAPESVSYRPVASHVAVRTLSSDSLFQQGEHEIGIAHGESLYRLKITRQGKLILNK